MPKAWAKAGLLDFVCTMSYIDSPQMFRDSRLRTIKTENAPIKVYPGIGTSLWKLTDGKNPQRLREQVLAVREEGFNGFCFFEWTPRTEKLLTVLGQH